MYGVRKKIVEQTEQFAVDAFKDHEINYLMTNDVYRHFDCRNRNGSSIYQFNVITFPGRLIITGDVGDLMLKRCRDMLEWAPRAVHSIDYFAEKVVAGKVKVDYDPEVVQEVINEALGDRDSDAARLEISDVTNPHSTLMEMYDSAAWDGCDWPGLWNWHSNFLWCREAFKWFCANHFKEETVSAEGGWV